VGPGKGFPKKGAKVPVWPIKEPGKAVYQGFWRKNWGILFQKMWQFNIGSVLGAWKGLIGKFIFRDQAVKRFGLEKKAIGNHKAFPGIFLKGPIPGVSWGW